MSAPSVSDSILHSGSSTFFLAFCVFGLQCKWLCVGMAMVRCVCCVCCVCGVRPYVDRMRCLFVCDENCARVVRVYAILLSNCVTAVCVCVDETIEFNPHDNLLCITIERTTSTYKHIKTCYSCGGGALDGYRFGQSY